MKGFIMYVAAILIVITGMIVLFEVMKPQPATQKAQVREMPKMFITVDEEKYTAAKGPYCWSSGNQTECTDSSGNPFDYKRNSPPIQITTDSSIEISFSKEPNHVSTLMLDRNHKETSLKGLSFPPPTEKGVYGYSVYATWNEGDITFMFLIDVQ